jgi:chloramphenicol-sensitive protein RarD
MKKGIWYAVGAYVTWGLFPIYWKWLHQVPALQLLAHRIGWSFVLLALLLFLRRRWPEFWKAVSAPRVFRIYLVAAILIAVNWLVYLWAVNANFIVEASLGYFINPLFSVLLGTVFLHERLRPLQWLPIGLALLGVIYLTVTYGSLPWLALTLAFSFGMYGLVKKTAPLGSSFGLTLETGILFLPALGYLLYANASGQGAFLHLGPRVNLLLVGAGLVTILPLLMFASAARSIPLTMVGILQYITPTMQFLLGVLVYHETFTHERLIGFSIVWVALIIFWLEGFLASRRQVAEATSQA